MQSIYKYLTKKLNLEDKVFRTYIIATKKSLKVDQSLSRKGLILGSTEFDLFSQDACALDNTATAPPPSLHLLYLCLNLCLPEGFHDSRAKNEV